MAITLMEMLPPSGWGDVATRQQLEGVERAVHLRIGTLDLKLDARCDHLEARIDVLEARFDALETRLDALIDAIEARIDALGSTMSQEFRVAVAEMRVSTIKWAVGAVISVAGVGAAIGALVLQLR